MALDQHLLEILVCVQCKGTLVLVEAGRGLLCQSCQLKYPVRDDVPIMLVEEAVSLAGTQPKVAASPTAAAGAGGRAGVATAPARTSAALGTNVTFRIEGKGPPQTLQLDRGTCKAIGRALTDLNKTAMFHVDVGLTIDDSTKNLIQQYVAKQFRRAETPAKESDLGFHRTGDIVLDDGAVSRLHAMIFFDEVGVGVLDLVSKNGTYVNGEEIESRLLRQGDQIEIGESKLVFVG